MKDEPAMIQHANELNIEGKYNFCFVPGCKNTRVYSWLSQCWHLTFKVIDDADQYELVTSYMYLQS